MEKDLPITSYAVLGLLAMRSWTGYELAQQSRRTLQHFWPKEDSVLYEEPRRLVRLGYATSTEDRAGGRARNRYAITDAGRAALTTWLAQPSTQAPRLVMEQVVRMMLAAQGTPEDMLRELLVVRAWASERMDTMLGISRAILAGESAFPDRDHINTLGCSFFLDVYAAVLQWSVLAEREVRAWPGASGFPAAPGSLAMLAAAVERADAARAAAAQAPRRAAPPAM
ncbi:MAG: PadR family transcriptional regulator [Sporichthyaceae bacterium]